MQRVDQMAQHVKHVPHKHDNVRFIPRAHIKIQMWWRASASYSETVRTTWEFTASLPGVHSTTAAETGDCDSETRQRLGEVAHYCHLGIWKSEEE